MILIGVIRLKANCGKTLFCFFFYRLPCKKCLLNFSYLKTTILPSVPMTLASHSRLTAGWLGHAYLGHLSTEYRLALSPDMSAECRPIYRPSIGQHSRPICRPCLGRYIDRHATDINRHACRPTLCGCFTDRTCVVYTSLMFTSCFITVWYTG